MNEKKGPPPLIIDAQREAFESLLDQLSTFIVSLRQEPMELAEKEEIINDEDGANAEHEKRFGKSLEILKQNKVIFDWYPTQRKRGLDKAKVDFIIESEYNKFILIQVTSDSDKGGARRKLITFTYGTRKDRRPPITVIQMITKSKNEVPPEIVSIRIKNAIEYSLPFIFR